jgi:hypothetical protein
MCHLAVLFLEEVSNIDLSKLTDGVPRVIGDMNHGLALTGECIHLAIQKCGNYTFIGKARTMRATNMVPLLGGFKHMGPSKTNPNAVLSISLIGKEP